MTKLTFSFRILGTRLKILHNFEVGTGLHLSLDNVLIMMMAIYCIRTNGVPIVTSRLSVQTTHSKGYFLFPVSYRKPKWGHERYGDHGCHSDVQLMSFTRENAVDLHS